MFQKFYLFVMSPSNMPIWICFTELPHTTTPIQVVNLLSKTKFNSKKNFSTFDHRLQFILYCNKYDINEGVMWNIFTLTLTCLAKEWYRSLPFTSINTWDEFTKNFLHAFEDYNYEKVCDHLDALRRFESETLNDFLIRFKLIFL